MRAANDGVFGQLAQPVRRLMTSLAHRARGRLFRKYAALLLLLVTSALTITAGVEGYYSYQENRAALVTLQHEKARGAAAIIEQFMKEIEGQLGWTTHVTGQGAQSAEQRRLDFLRLLRQAPAVTELTYVDRQGLEQLKVSRVSMDEIGAGRDRGTDPIISAARESRRYVSPVYFRKESEPYLTIAVASGRQSDVTIAEVNLKFIWDVISRIRAGKAGIAYAVDDRGLLIAHPNISIVLAKTDLSSLPHVAKALTRRSNEFDMVSHQAISKDSSGNDVLVAHAFVERQGWHVFVEQPLGEAFEPIYQSLQRTLMLSLVGLAIAAAAALWFAQRMVVPIQALADGATRMGGGDLDQTIAISSGDEFELVAQRFNEMSARLRDSYASLEQKVQLRTEELALALRLQARSVDELRALGDIGQAVSSTLDLAEVLETIVGHAFKISEADGGAIYVVDDARDRLRLVARRGLVKVSGLPWGAEAIGLGEPVAQKVLSTGQPAEGGADGRSVLVLPLVYRSRPIGTLVVLRAHTEPFGPETVGLLQTFAAQSAIAIYNASLFHEIAEKSRQIEIASRHKSQFLANMSHELRTPLNAILGYTELIQDGIYGTVPLKVTEVLERVQANGHHLLGLINDVLDLSKIEAGQLKLNVDDYALASVIQVVTAAAGPLAAEKRLEFRLDVPTDLPAGRGDERRIAQVLLNLVGNAIKFTEHGHVTLSASAEGARYRIEVSDTGPGIPPEEQDRIFDEFHQIDSSSTKKAGGTGLGLSIARRIVALHGGQLSVASVPGSGATFRVDLPMRVANDREAA